MKTIIAGSRDEWSYYAVDNAVVECGWEVSQVVCGMAPGIDSVGWAWAHINSIPIDECPADWNRFGNSAGPIRNAFMAARGNALICIHRFTPGSLNMLAVARKRGLKIYEVRISISQSFDGQQIQPEDGLR